jgi:hypothetical protein
LCIRVTREFLSLIAHRICELIIVRTFPGSDFLDEERSCFVVSFQLNNPPKINSNTVSLLFRFYPQGAYLEGPPPDGILLC